jgi:hypothetical protein
MKSRAIYVLPLWALVAFYRETFTLTFVYRVLIAHNALYCVYFFILFYFFVIIVHPDVTFIQLLVCGARNVSIFVHVCMCVFLLSCECSVLRSSPKFSCRYSYCRS